MTWGAIAIGARATLQAGDVRTRGGRALIPGLN